MQLMPLGITAEEIVAAGLACAADYPDRLRLKGALLFLSLAVVPTALYFALTVCGASHPNACAVCLAAQALLSFALALDRGKRTRWELFGSLHRFWRQRLGEGNLDALAELASSAQSAQWSLWKLAAVAQPLTMLGFALAPFLFPSFVDYDGRRLAVMLAWLVVLGVGTIRAERHVASLVRLPHVARCI